jgi:PTH1 family peptidyl-tRNA hydrolase
MKVIVGLGNPGSQYVGTRHNVGFAVIDYLAAGPDVGRCRPKFEADIAELSRGGDKVLLVKPLTYMNLSGRSVRQLLDFYQAAAEGLLVVCDDFNLPLGKLRFRAKGSAGGHKGLKSIQDHLGSADYARLRIGVGAPEENVVDFVLDRFRPSERPIIDEAIQTAGQGVLVWLDQGTAVCMNRFNG